MGVELQLNKTVFRNGSPSKNFTIIPNAIIEDSTISGCSRMVLILALSRPPNWYFRVSWISKTLKFAKNKTYDYIAELKKAEYCKFEQRRDARGKTMPCVYVFTDTPGVFADPLPGGQEPGIFPLPENPLPESPLPGPRDTYQEAKYSNNQKRNKKTDLVAVFSKEKANTRDVRISQRAPAGVEIIEYDRHGLSKPSKAVPVKSESVRGHRWIEFWEKIGRADLAAKLRRVGTLTLPSGMPPSTRDVAS